MLFHRDKSYILVAGVLAFLLTACSGTMLSPIHEGKFIFEGKVTDQKGHPISNAWVKVRGWETLTNAQGKWREVQVVNCGALRKHPISYTENDAILVVADGYAPAEDKYVVKHPGFFSSCRAKQTIILNTTLVPESNETRSNRDATKFKPRTYPEIPLPEPRRRKENPGLRRRPLRPEPRVMPEGGVQT